MQQPSIETAIATSAAIWRQRARTAAQRPDAATVRPGCRPRTRPGSAVDARRVGDLEAGEAAEERLDEHLVVAVGRAEARAHERQPREVELPRVPRKPPVSPPAGSSVRPHRRTRRCWAPAAAVDDERRAEQRDAGASQRTMRRVTGGRGSRHGENDDERGHDRDPAAVREQRRGGQRTEAQDATPSGRAAPDAAPRT